MIYLLLCSLRVMVPGIFCLSVIISILKGKVLGPEGWNILSLIVSVTSDSASVMVKAAEIAGLNRVACITHCLHNSVNAALEKAEHLGTLVDKCHDLAKFFHCSPKMASALEDQQQQVNSAEPSV